MRVVIVLWNKSVEFIIKSIADLADLDDFIHNLYTAIASAPTEEIQKSFF